MEVRIFLLLFFLTFIITDDVTAKFGSSSSRGGSRSYSSGSRSYSSGSRTSSRPSGGTSGHSQIPSSSSSSSSRHNTGSSSFGHGNLPSGHSTGSSSFGHSNNPSSGRTTGSNPIGHSSSGQTSHQQNKDSSTSLLHAEGGGATRPSQNNPLQSSYQPSAPHQNIGTYPGNTIGRPSFTTDNKQNSPSSPSAPPIDHMSKATMTSSQNHGSAPFDRSNAPFNPHGNVPHNNPSWSNPHFNPSQPYPPVSTPNIGFKDNLRQPSMPVPSHASSMPPHPSSNFNQHAPPYPVHSFNQASQPHPTYNSGHSFSGHTMGHPPSYPSHIPPPAPNTFGNPYSTHPVGGAPYGMTGPAYHPQQHVLAQPAAQPYIPGQTVIMVPNQQDSGRGFGQMVKEALVFSTINAGVNRLINPHHHYVSDSRPIGTSPTTSETHITYNNHYFNNAPPNNSPVVPSQSGTIMEQGNTPFTNPTNYPNPIYNPAIAPGRIIPPTSVLNNDTVINSVNTSTGSTMATNNNMGSNPVLPPNGPTANTLNNQAASDKEIAANYPQYKITDNELWMLTEELFAKQEIDVSKYLTLHLQNTVIKSENVTDNAAGPLIYLQQDIYDHPTILAIRALYDNYEHNSTVKETRTAEKRKEENLLLDLFLNTNVMAKTMQWLSSQGFIDPDDFEKKDTLRHIWFNQFDGATSGFERVFTSERYGSDLLGVQDWLYFEYQESKKRINYYGYVDMLKLGDKASLLKLNFRMDDIIRPNATIFVGTLPELEMSLYTICFHARPNNLCPVSLGGSKFNIYTHSFRYYGKDLIDLALPIF